MTAKQQKQIYFAISKILIDTNSEFRFLESEIFIYKRIKEITLERISKVFNTEITIEYFIIFL